MGSLDTAWVGGTPRARILPINNSYSIKVYCDIYCTRHHKAHTAVCPGRRRAPPADPFNTGYRVREISQIIREIMLNIIHIGYHSIADYLKSR